MAFKEGDFLEIEYTVSDAEDKKVLATTDQKRAKEAGILNEKMQYGPVVVVIGAPGVLKGLDRELRNLKAGEAKSFTFKPEDAFGERYEDLVRVMPMSEFRQREIEPYPGMQVNLDNMTAIVKSVNSGRVVVDANHPYAGRDVVYDVKVVRQLTSDKEKVEALGKSNGITPSSVTASADKVEIMFNNSVAKNADYFVGKAGFIASVFSNLKNIKKIEIKEEYINEEKKEEKK